MHLSFVQLQYGHICGCFVAKVKLSVTLVHCKGAVGLSSVIVCDCIASVNGMVIL